MNSIGVISRNSGLKLGSEIIGRVANFALVIYAARRLGAVDFGLYSLALGLGFILSMIADMGLNTIISREVAKTGKKNLELVNKAFSVKLLL